MELIIIIMGVVIIGGPILYGFIIDLIDILPDIYDRLFNKRIIDALVTMAKSIDLDISRNEHNSNQSLSRQINPKMKEIAKLRSKHKEPYDIFLGE